MPEPLVVSHLLGFRLSNGPRVIATMVALTCELVIVSYDID